MKNQELFDKTVGILVKAYQNETLAHGQPCGCAIGNLIAGNNGLQIIKKSEGHHWLFDNGDQSINTTWTDVHAYGGMYEYSIDSDYQKGLKELLSTGYATNETCLIEKAFESPCINKDGYYIDDDSIDTDGYMGLMSVVDTLMQIHEATPEQAKAAKELFTTTT